MTGSTWSCNESGKLSDKATVAENFCDFDVIRRRRPTSFDGWNFGLKYCSTVKLYGFVLDSFTTSSSLYSYLKKKQSIQTTTLSKYFSKMFNNLNIRLNFLAKVKTVDLSP